MKRRLFDITDIDIREDDVILVKDIIKNNLHEAMRDKEDPDRKERIDSLARFLFFLEYMIISFAQLKKNEE